MKRLVLAALTALALLGQARAEGTRSIVSVPTRAWNWIDTSVGVGASAESVDFTASGGCAFAVQVYNKDASANLLVQLIPCGTSVTSSQLTTPANATASQVQVILPAEQPVSFEGWFQGIKWQSQTTAVSAKVRWVE